MGDSIIVRGCEVPIGAPAKTWEETGLKFAKMIARECRPDLGVLHWTAGENRAETTFHYLEFKGLSVHFVIDNDGVIWQFGDPAIFACQHAGRANARSVGIEVSCYGWRRHNDRNPNSNRGECETEIHGWKTTVADYLPAQYFALDRLCTTLSDLLPIPKRASMLRRRLTSDEFDAYSGWVGHYHVDRLSKKHPKIDPGSAPLDHLAKLWGSHGS